MTELLELKSAENEVSAALKKLSPDWGSFNLDRHEIIIVNLIKELMNDTGEHSWIDYWIYELDAGKKYNNGSVTIRNENVPLKTIDDLYTCILGWNKKQNNKK